MLPHVTVNEFPSVYNLLQVPVFLKQDIANKSLCKKRKEKKKVYNMRSQWKERKEWRSLSSSIPAVVLKNKK